MRLNSFDLLISSKISSFKSVIKVDSDKSLSIRSFLIGAISQKMGLIMKSLSKYVQTLSITHIPQIAAMGSSHYKIYKYDEDNVTKTTISKLAEEERIVEIAKIVKIDELLK